MSICHGRTHRVFAIPTHPIGALAGLLRSIIALAPSNSLARNACALLREISMVVVVIVVVTVVVVNAFDVYLAWPPRPPQPQHSPGVINAAFAARAEITAVVVVVVVARDNLVLIATTVVMVVDPVDGFCVSIERAFP